MNRRYVSAALLMAMAVIVIWVAGCTRPQSSGPIPKPLAVASGTVLPTPEPITTGVVETVSAGATATVVGATPEPVTQPATPPPTNTPWPPAATVALSGQTSYTVKPGDRLFSIGRAFQINPYAIAQANRLGPPYTIHPGQVLVIPAGGTWGPTATPGPAPTTHTVAAGETVYSIARKYGKSAAAIINANNLGNPNFIFPGQVLNIP
jgi:LysM repeat protein